MRDDAAPKQMISVDAAEYATLKQAAERLERRKVRRSMLAAVFAPIWCGIRRIGIGFVAMFGGIAVALAWMLKTVPATPFAVPTILRRSIDCADRNNDPMPFLMGVACSVGAQVVIFAELVPRYGIPWPYALAAALTTNLTSLAHEIGRAKEENASKA